MFLKISYLIVLIMSALFYASCGHDDNISKPEQVKTIHIPQDYPSIQKGIIEASDGDTILVSDGTYKGAGNKNIDYLGKSVMVLSVNGREKTIIECDSLGRGFTFCNGEGLNSVLDGFTIREGFAAMGGAISCEGSSPSIRNCIITANISTGGFGHGGGIYCNDSSPQIDNCTISFNLTSGYYGSGGGIYCYNANKIEITNCIISNNSASGYYSDGGGICFHSTDNISLKQCYISGNYAKRDGGGILCYDSQNSLFQNCFINENNVSSHGGGLSFCYQSPFTLQNCVITGNKSVNQGSAVYCFDYSSASILNCTIAENSGTKQAGALYCDTYSPPSVMNSIFWNNKPAQLSIESETSVIVFSDIMGGFQGTGNIDDDPAFSGIGDYHLNTDSPCIDSGIDTGILFDIEGNTRPCDHPEHINIFSPFDMGAYEFCLD